MRHLHPGLQLSAACHIAAGRLLAHLCVMLCPQILHASLLWHTALGSQLCLLSRLNTLCWQRYIMFLVTHQQQHVLVPTMHAFGHSVTAPCRSGPFQVLVFLAQKDLLT